MKTIEAREISIAARAERIKALERRIREHDVAIHQTLAAIRRLGHVADSPD